MPSSIRVAALVSSLALLALFVSCNGTNDQKPITTQSEATAEAVASPTLPPTITGPDPTATPVPTSTQTPNPHAFIHGHTNLNANSHPDTIA